MGGPEIECCRMPYGVPLPGEEALRWADALRALADPTRLRILSLLADQAGPLCVCEITPLFAQSQPTISHHLRVLADAGLISLERRGVWSHYSATDLGRRRIAAVRGILGGGPDGDMGDRATA